MTVRRQQETHRARDCVRITTELSVSLKTWKANIPSPKQICFFLFATQPNQTLGQVRNRMFSAAFWKANILSTLCNFKYYPRKVPFSQILLTDRPLDIPCPSGASVVQSLRSIPGHLLSPNAVLLNEGAARLTRYPCFHPPTRKGNVLRNN